MTYPNAVPGRCPGRCPGRRPGRRAGGSIRHNAEPGTPRRRGFPRVLIGFGPVSHQVGRTLWGRASSLPVRVVGVGRAFPRECGVSGTVGSPVPGGLPRNLENQAEARVPGEPGTALCATDGVREGRSGTMPNPAPRGGAVFRVSSSASVPFPTRLGGHCGGGLPACPSGSLESAGHSRESAGFRALWDPRFPAASLVTWRTRQKRASRGSPVRHCAQRTACGRVDPAQCRTRHPEGRFFPSDPGRHLPLPRTLPLPPTGWKPVATQRPFFIV